MSKYIGVYENKYAPTKDTYPYRAAVKRYVNSNPEYNNIGYFESETVAAYVYNVHALCTFGKSAVLNPVVMEDDDMEDELIDYYERRPGFDSMVRQATEIIENAGYELKFHELAGDS